MEPTIAEHAVIGDGRSAALIAKDGTIDWLCWPRFDSPAFFCSILDARRGGRFRLMPALPARASWRYLPDSNVLETTFSRPEGTLRLFDWMPVADEETKRKEILPDHELLRVLTCVEGEMEVEVDFDPRPHFGTKRARLQRSLFGLRLVLRPGVLDLASTLPLPESGRWRGTLRAGESISFQLTYTIDKPSILRPFEEVPLALERSVEWWREWASATTYQGPFREAVVRSALALKLMIYAPSGGIVAAPTTSLPEWVGASLNWDYRFCWLRDGALVVRALLGLGYMREANAFVSWLLHSTRLTRPKLAVLYDVYGRAPPPERDLRLAGFRGSRPVRVGNAAVDQLQLDIYGEVIDAATRYIRHSGGCDNETSKMLTGFGLYLCKNWARPDEGIWEPRSGRKLNTHSRALCWVALDRLLELCRRGHLASDHAELFAATRDTIRETIERDHWNPRLRSYTGAAGSDETDATLLLLPWYGFLSPAAERMQLTWARIQEQLSAGDGLLYRYRSRVPEGAFGVCSFWAVDFLARGGGSLEQAEARFASLLDRANDLGLYSEELAPETGEFLGNFPQAFTHLGLINAALSLEERRSREPSAAEGGGA